LLASVEAFKLRENLNYYAPMGNLTITPEEEYQNQLSVSGAFRTVTASAYSSNNNALAPARTTTGPFSPYPMPPYQQQNGMQSPYSPVAQWQDNSMQPSSYPSNSPGQRIERGRQQPPRVSSQTQRPKGERQQ
jgi:hypothetical protein